MRFVTWNVNGLASAVRNGFLDAVRGSEADVLTLQELKCSDARARELLAPLLDEYCVTIRASAKAGRAGVAILTRGVHEARDVVLGHDGLDAEGRLVAVAFGGVEYWSLYAPSGASSKERLRLKHEFLRIVLERALAVGERDVVVLAGDLNVAHGLTDVEGRTPRKQPGFLPEERRVLDLLAAGRWRDLVRTARGDAPGPFTWRSRSHGWRLDHAWASPASGITASSVTLGAARPISDHHALELRLVLPRGPERDDSESDRGALHDSAARQPMQPKSARRALTEAGARSQRTRSR